MFNPLAAFQGTGAIVGLLLIALAGRFFSLILLAPHRAIAIVVPHRLIWHSLVA